MADITKLQDLELLQLGTPDIPIIRLAEPSNAGSTTLKFDNPIYQKDDTTAVTKAIYLAIQRVTDKKILVVYVPASGFTDAYTATTITRGVKRAGIDATAVDSDYDIDLPTGSQVIGVVSQFHVLQLMQWAFGNVASGGVELIIGNETASTMTLSVKDNAGKKGLIRRNIAGYAEYSNDGSTWVRVDTAAPANITTRTTTAALANNGELYQDTDDSNSLHFKDNGGADVKLIDDTTQKIPKTTVQKYYATSTTGNDSYAITLTPAPASLSAIEGIPIILIVDTDNTGGCTLNPNGLGAKQILKFNNSAMETGDIKANTLYEVAYHANTDSFKLLSSVASQMTTAEKTDLTDGGSTILHYHTQTCKQTTRAMNTASGSVNIAHGLGVIPKYVHAFAICETEQLLIGAANTVVNQILRSEGWSDGTNNYCNIVSNTSGDNQIELITAQNTVSTSSYAIVIDDYYNDGTARHRTQSATITFDATNVTLNWTLADAGTPTSAEVIRVMLIIYS